MTFLGNPKCRHPCRLAIEMLTIYTQTLVRPGLGLVVLLGSPRHSYAQVSAAGQDCVLKVFEFCERLKIPRP